MDVPPRLPRAPDDATARSRTPRRGRGQALLAAAPPPRRVRPSDHAPPDVAPNIGTNAAANAVLGAVPEKVIHDEGKGGAPATDAAAAAARGADVRRTARGPAAAFITSGPSISLVHTCQYRYWAAAGEEGRTHAAGDADAVPAPTAVAADGHRTAGAPREPAIMAPTSTAAAERFRADAHPHFVTAPAISAATATSTQPAVSTHVVTAIGKMWNREWPPGQDDLRDPSRMLMQTGEGAAAATTGVNK